MSSFRAGAAADDDDAPADKTPEQIYSDIAAALTEKALQNFGNWANFEKSFSIFDQNDGFLSKFDQNSTKFRLKYPYFSLNMVEFWSNFDQKNRYFDQKSKSFFRKAPSFQNL